MGCATDFLVSVASLFRGLFLPSIRCYFQRMSFDSFHSRISQIVVEKIQPHSKERIVNGAVVYVANLVVTSCVVLAACSVVAMAKMKKAVSYLVATVTLSKTRLAVFSCVV